MANQEKKGEERAAVLATVSHFVEAADGDTLYRDVYLQRAAALLGPVVSEARYREAVSGRARIERLLAQSKAAVARQDWKQVQELSGRAAGIRQVFGADSDAVAVAQKVYDARAVTLDSLSASLVPFAAQESDRSQIRTAVINALRALEEADPTESEFYAARGRALAALALTGHPTRSATGAERSEDTPQQQALQAAERGDVEALQRLADSMLGARAADARPSAGEHAPVGTKRIGVPDVLAEPFPEKSLGAASALGLEQVEVRLGSPALEEAIAEFIERYAWGASPAVYEMAREGIVQLRAVMDAETKRFDMSEIQSGGVEALAENVSLFALHLYVNSAGLRYLPLPLGREFALVESHPDGDESVTPLLKELGLDRRRALARAQIESALLRQGTRIVSECLGLDPYAFRVVCLPPDLFVRIGRQQGWGQREEWTHLDGYQVLRGGRLSALVGGHARYGGLTDLCAISFADARESVVARFAVIRRDRFGVRLD